MSTEVIGPVFAALMMNMMLGMLFTIPYWAQREFHGGRYSIKEVVASYFLFVPLLIVVLVWEMAKKLAGRK